MDRLLQTYKLNEVAKKTHISPLSLERLFNYEFEKLDNIKIKGFIKILETEYPDLDFSELKEKFEEYSKKDEDNIIEQTPQQNNNKNYLLIGLIVLLVSLIYFIQNKSPKIDNNSINNTQKTNIQKKDIKENNDTNTNININEEIEIEENNTQTAISNISDFKSSVEKTITDKKVVITPLEKVWFRVTYLDDDSSKEYLTSHQIELNGSKRIFIKFGHGMVKIDYNGTILEPNTRKIVRVIIEDGEINITKKRVKEFE